MKPTLSIIIPVYNIESYIHQCIAKLIVDIGDELEILLIDDGSTDRSGQICDEYAAKYDFVHVYHTQNGGVSSARNIGIKHATGVFVYFIDGDDWFTGIYSLLKELKFHEKANKKVFAIPFNIYDKNEQIIKSIEYQSEIIETNKIEKYAHNHALWGYVFNLDTIKENGIRFHEELKYSEDWCFTAEYLSQTPTIVCLKDCCYHYRAERIGSAMNKQYNSEQLLLHFISFDYLLQIKACKQCNKYIQNERRIFWRYLIRLTSRHLHLFGKNQLQKEIKNRLTPYYLFNDLKTCIRIVYIFCK